MNDAQVTITFTAKNRGSTTGVLTVKYGDEVLHTDRLDIAKDRPRTAFLEKLKERCPGVNLDEAEQLLLKEVDQAMQTPEPSPVEPPAELDVNRIVRPHLFHVPEVSGLLIPVAQVQANRVGGKWRLYLQWADGRRECIDLPDYLDLGNGHRLWFSKNPPVPSVTTPSRWSSQGRAQWLVGHVPDMADLFKGIYAQLETYLEFPEDDTLAITATLSLWIMATYVYPVWSAVPYLSVGGPLGSGKSRLFEVMGQLVHAPIHSSNTTAACLFRTLDAKGGTMLLDEAERLNDNTPDAGEIRSILLAGYKRGGQASRLEKVGDGFAPVSFDVYGPKAVAAIASMPSALASRCIPIIMFRAPQDSPVPKRRIDPEAPVWRELRDDLHCMALACGVSFVQMVDWLPSCPDLNGRSLELWLPILAMAKLVEGAGVPGLVEVVEAFGVKSSRSAQEDVVPEVDDILLRRLKRMLEDKPWGVTAGELLAVVKEDEPTLFTRYTPRGIGTILKRYGVTATRTCGKRLLRATENQWRAIGQSYGIVFDGEDEGKDGSG